MFCIFASYVFIFSNTPNLQRMRNLNLKRKIIKRLFIFSIISVFLAIFIIVISVIDIEEAKAPPKGAVRKGDLKEYYWLKKISVSQNVMRICIYNDYNGDLALDADFPIVYFNDTTLNGICAFDPCHILLYNGHTVEPSKIYGGYLK